MWNCNGFEEKYLNYISNSLQKLELDRIKNIKGNEFINLSSLSYLGLNSLENKIFNTFPSNLKYLYLNNCNNLNESILNILPSTLIKLEIKYCKKLKNLKEVIEELKKKRKDLEIII